MKGACCTQPFFALAASFLVLGATPLRSQSAAIEVQSVAFTADGSCVVFVCDEATDGVYELFSSAIDPAAPLQKLSTPLPEGGDIKEWPPLAISPAGRVLYVADARVDNVYELFSVPADGSLAPVRLSANGSVQAFEISPTGATVVFRRDGNLFSRSIDGSGNAVVLYPPGNQPVVADRISPDGTRVAYASRVFGEPRHYVLWCQPIDGSTAPTQLAELRIHLYSGIEEEEMAADLTFVDDGQALLFRELRSDSSRPKYIVPVDGSAAPQRIFAGTLAPDGLHFLGGGAGPSVFEWSVWGGSLVPLLLPHTFSTGQQHAYAYQPRCTADGDWIVYRAVDAELNALGLFSIPREGARRGVRLAEADASASNLLSLQSSRVVFGGGNPFVVRSVAVDGSSPAVLGSVPNFLGGPGGVGVSPDGQMLVLTGTLPGATSNGLHAMPTDGLGPVVTLAASLTGGFDGIWVRNGFALFRHDGQLFGVALDGHGPPMTYHEPGPPRFPIRATPSQRSHE